MLRLTPRMLLAAWIGVLVQLGCIGYQNDVELELTYNVTPDAAWEPGLPVYLYADARRNPEMYQEDIFAGTQFPGTYPREEGQRFPFVLPDVRAGETIIVQGYICAQGTTDCSPSDRDNPPSCAVKVRILWTFQPSCQPVFTWTENARCRVKCL